jgi:translation initiation factor eIF-2B subunit gamma
LVASLTPWAGEEKLFVAIDRESEEVLLIQPLEAIEDELETRMALLDS